MGDWHKGTAADVQRGDVVEYKGKVSDVYAAERDGDGKVVLKGRAKHLTLNPNEPVEFFR